MSPESRGRCTRRSAAGDRVRRRGIVRALPARCRQPSRRPARAGPAQRRVRIDSVFRARRSRSRLPQRTRSRGRARRRGRHRARRYRRHRPGGTRSASRTSRDRDRCSATLRDLAHRAPATPPAWILLSPRRPRMESFVKSSARRAVRYDWQIRAAGNRMRCLSDSTVIAFLERRLSRQQQDDVEIHVDNCEHCRRVLIELVAVAPPSSNRPETHTTHPNSSSSDSDALAKGTVIGRFVILNLLGLGGMGVVYTAYDPELDRKVAIKLLRPAIHDVSATHSHLLAEAQAMARISHPNVISIHDVGAYRGQVFAAMELVEGTTLRRWMAERSRTWREVVEVFLLAGERLAAAHAASVVHGDFKPENVLLGRDRRVKV